MEFKVFKNETGKILKEYWVTPSEWESLDKTTVQEGDIYHIVGTLDKGDLSADVNASLAKADSSLQKPTTTLAKESFVKVGIDGTQSFDENSYVVAPTTDGTAGQVLKKTADGTEWADESGGGSSVEVVQTTGTSTTAVMSQKAVTDLTTAITDNFLSDVSATYILFAGNFDGLYFSVKANTQIFWGDGSVDAYSTQSDPSHTYSDNKDFHWIKIVGLTEINENAFENCTGVLKIIIGSEVASIGASAFSGCEYLKTIKINSYGGFPTIASNAIIAGTKIIIPRTTFYATDFQSELEAIISNGFNIVPDGSYTVMHHIKFTLGTVTSGNFSDGDSGEVVINNTDTIGFTIDASTGTDTLATAIDGSLAVLYQGADYSSAGIITYDDTDHTYHLRGSFHDGTEVVFTISAITDQYIKIK